jgi:hypothetical protein
MIVALACFAIFFRKQRVILFTGAMALITFSLSLGTRLWVDGHETSVPLPGAAFTHLPLLGGFKPVRFSLYTSLFIAAMFSIGLDEVRRRLRVASVRGPSILSPRLRTFAASSISVVVAAAVILPLIPADTQPSQQTNIPSFFTSAAVDAIPEGGVVLAYPYPDSSGQSLSQPTHGMMLDQAASGMRFKLIGGYGWFPSSTGSQPTATTAPAVLNPRSVQALFDSAFWGTSSDELSPSRTNATSDLRALLTNYDVDAVILQPQGADPAAVARTVTGTIGCPTYYPDLAVWLHVRQRLANRVPGRDVNTCGRPPDVVKPFAFVKGSTVSGTIALAAKTSAILRIVRIAYYLSGGSLHDKLIGRSATPDGWVAIWNTRAVPNSTYVLRSIAVDSAGWSTTSSGTTIIVKN